MRSHKKNHFKINPCVLHWMEYVQSTERTSCQKKERPCPDLQCIHNTYYRIIAKDQDSVVIETLDQEIWQMKESNCQLDFAKKDDLKTPLSCKPFPPEK